MPQGNDAYRDAAQAPPARVFSPACVLSALATFLFVVFVIGMPQPPMKPHHQETTDNLAIIMRGIEAFRESTGGVAGAVGRCGDSAPAG